MNKNELHKIAPTLSKLKGNGTGFRVPKDYFNAFEEQIISEINISSLKKSKEFSIPDNYFESVEDSVLAKLKAESLQIKENQQVPKDYFNAIEDKVFEKLNSESKETKVISLTQKIKKVVIPLAVAASLALIFVFTNNNSEITFDNLASADIENWIENGQAELDAYQLASIYDDIEIEDDFINETITDSELLDYLDSTNIEQLILEN